MLESTYLSEGERLRVVESYLLHEHKKLSHLNSNDQKAKIDHARKKLGTSDVNYIGDYMKTKKPNEFINSLGLKPKWELFHIVSYGVYDKELWNCVGHPKCVWNYMESLSLFDCVFETPLGWMKEINTEEPTFNQALEYAKSHNSSLKNNDKEYDRHSSEDRSKDPIIGRRRNGEILIHDGNGRLAKIIYSIVCRNTQINKIKAFVGKKGRKPSSIDIKVFDSFKKDVFIKLTS